MTSFTPLVGSSGTAPRTYYVSSGTLPSGLTLDATTGTVTGSATTSQGAADVVFAVRDANASVAATTSTVSFTVNAQPTAVATTTAQVLTVGTAMTSFVPLTATGGTGALTYSVSTGTLPTGLTLDATTGAVTGTATTSQGAANVVFAAKDSNNAVAATTSTVSFTVNGRLTATATTTAQVLTVGAAMTRFTPLTGSNGTAPLTYYVSSGTLPSGLTLVATTGAVTGTATTVQAAADIVFAVNDANGSIATTTSTVSFTINAQPTAIATTTAQVLTVGTAMTSFTPMVGSSGTAPLTYYVSSGTLPSGLVVDATTGAVTGTATTSQGAADVVFAVRDANASIAATTSTVNFTVNGRPTATATTTAQVLTVGTAMTSFVPLTATGGTGALTYYVSSGTLPSGLTLDAATGAVTGTATASQGASNVVFAVSDGNGSIATTTSTVSFTVNAQPTAAATTTAQVLTVGTAMTSFTPLLGLGGTAPLTYYVSSGTLPSGLALDATTGAVTGTATSSQGAADVVFAVRDANASVAATTSTVNFTVNGRPTATATTTAQVLTVGAAMTGFTPLAGSGGSGSLTYFVISGTLPAGLSLDASSGEVIGTPTNAHAVVTVIFAVKDSNLAVAATTSNVNFTINARPTAAATTTAQVLTIGSAMTSFTPLVGSNGTAPLTYYVSSGTLPSGLTLDATTGAVTGTATTIQVSSPVIFGVKDANNSVAVTSSTVSFTVNTPPTASANTSAQVLSVGAAMTSFTPLAGSGGTGTLTYFISSGTLPAGLSLNGTSGAVTGAPTMVQSAANVVFSVKDSNQAVASSTSTVSFTVNGQPTATANTTAQALTVGAAMTSFWPLAGHGGTGTLTYYLSSGTLPTGLSLDGSTGAVTGTPTIAHSAVTLTFAVKDSNNAVAVTTSSVAFTVNALPVATATTTAQILTVGAAMTSFVPLTATGGTGALTYYVSSGTLPSGLTLDATTGAVTGTATSVQVAANVVFSVRDANNAASATTSMVSFTVNAQPTAIAASTAQFLTVGTAMTGFTPLAGSGGTGALTYYVGSGTLPSGLSINSATGAVTGTPIAAHAVVTVVFSVKDSNNAVAATTSIVSFTVNAKPTAIAVTTAQILTINAPMTSFTPLTGSGGTGILTYYISSGTLPSGLTFDTATGTITGTPTILQAASSVMFAVKDANNSVAITTSTVSFTVNAPPTAIASQTAQVLTLGRAMTSFTPLVGSGGSGALVYYITGGSLPSGLSLNAATGAVTGIPTATQTIANVTFAVRDANGSVATTTSTVSFTINDHVVATTLIAASIIQQGVAATAFKPVSGAGGTGSLSYSVSPSLPSGLTMDGSSGVISGTPTLTHASSAFVVTVSDSLGDTNTANFSLAVLAAPAITAITPSLGTTSGGTTVLISGSSFSSDATVQFGSVLATSVVVNSTSSITAISPAGAVGTVDVRVTSQGWQSPIVAADQFTYSTIIPTTISLSASSLSPVLGKPVTLTAHISPSTATGTISFKSGATVLGTSALSGGTAIFVTTALSYGENSLTASYAGDGIYAASISSALTVSCSRPNPALDSDVRGIVSAQTSIALRSTQTVIDVNRRRLETLHSDDQQGFTNGINIGFATPMSKPVYTVDAFQPNDDKKLSPTNQFGTDRLIVDKDEPRVTGWRGPAGLSPDISVWTSGNITVGKLNVDGISVSNSFTTTGVTMGFDTRFTERLKVGFAGSVSYDDTKVGQNGSSNKALMLSGSSYASWALSDHIFIDSLLGYGSMSFDTKRYDSVGDTMITGKRSGSAFFGSLIGSYDQHTDALNSAVYSGFDVVYGQLDSYAETGSTDWALSFDKMTLQSYSFIFGLRGQYDYPVSWGVLSPTGRVEYRKSLSPASVQSLSYANGTPGSYQLTQSGAANWSLTTTVGIRASLHQGVNGSLELSNSSDMSTLHTYGLKGEIVWPF